MPGKIAENEFCGLGTELMCGLEAFERVDDYGRSDGNLPVIRQLVAVKQCEINAHRAPKNT